MLDRSVAGPRDCFGHRTLTGHKPPPSSFPRTACLSRACWSARERCPSNSNGKHGSCHHWMNAKWTCAKYECTDTMLHCRRSRQELNPCNHRLHTTSICMTACVIRQVQLCWMMAWSEQFVRTSNIPVTQRTRGRDVQS